MKTRLRDKLEAEDKRFEAKTISLDPLTPVIGAEVGGVDLSKPLAPEQFAEIRAAFNAFHVLVFRDQRLTPEDHKRFGRMFGRLHVHPYHVKNMAPDHAKTGPAPDPEILVVKADANSRYVAGEEWHSDVTCDEEPPMGSMLYITETPAIGGGDTCFLSAIRAYETLSPAMQEIAKGLTATHDGAKPYTGGYGTAAPEGGWPKTIHPVVIRHRRTASWHCSSIAASPPASTNSRARKAMPSWKCCGAISRHPSSSNAASAGAPTPSPSGTTASRNTMPRGTTIPIHATANGSRSSAKGRNRHEAGCSQFIAA